MPKVPSIPPFSADPQSLFAAMAAVRDILNGMNLSGAEDWATVLGSIFTTTSLEAVNDSWTTAGRPTGASLWVGRAGFNTTLSRFEVWSSTAWVQLSAGGVTDHGLLTGLGDDDHTQYLLTTALLAKILLIDGAASGIDADLLDGQHGAYYLDAANLNAGILPAARFDDTAHGNRGGGALHADVVAAGADGFMTGADKSKLDGIEALAEANNISDADATDLTDGGTTTLHSHAGNGGLVHITSQTASNDATIDFTSGIDNTYDAYLLIGSAVVPATDAVTAMVRASVGGVFKSGASDYGWARFAWNSGGTSSTTGDGSDTAWDIATSIGSAAGEGMRFSIIIGSPSNTSLRTLCSGNVSYDHSGGSLLGISFSGRTVGTIGTSAVDGFRFLFSSGNVESGEFTLYGLAGA